MQPQKVNNLYNEYELHIKIYIVSWGSNPTWGNSFFIFSFDSGACLSFFLSFFSSQVIMYILRFSVWCFWWFNYPGLHLYTKFQLTCSHRCMRCLIWTPSHLGCLGSSVGKSICLECRVLWVQIPPEATHFSFFHLSQVPVFLSFFLFISSHHAL